MSILGLSSGGGGSYIRFLPTLNAWKFKDQEIQLKTVVFDHGTIKTGWGLMQEGAAPSWVWDERLGVAGQQPSSEHKRGFSIKMWSKATGTVEWSSTGTGPVIGFEDIFGEIWNGRAANEGKVAVCNYKGSEARKVGKGNTRVPRFEISKWVDHGVVDWAGEAAEQAPEPKSEPKPKPAPAAPTSLDDDF